MCEAVSVPDATINSDEPFETWSATLDNTEELVKTPTRNRQFRLAHQNLCITHIDFEQRLLVGFTQLIVQPTASNLRKLYLNCRQCRVHRVLLECVDTKPPTYEGSSKLTGPKNSRVPSPAELPVVHTDPSVEICERDSKFRTLDSFQRRHSFVLSQTDPDEEVGELTIRIPPDFWPLVSNERPIRITLEFSLSKPKSGFYFIVPQTEGTLADRGVHAFTAGIPNTSRYWFPCVDCSEPCTWKIEVTVPEDMIAVAPGELVDAPYYTGDLVHKTYHFYLAQPVAAPYIGLAIGAFEVYPDPTLSNNAAHFCPTGLLPLLKHTISHVPEMIEYYEAILASQYPFATIKTVFVDRAFSDFQAYASLLIFPVDLLHSPQIIDQAIETRKIISLAIASQFFGCFIAMHTWSDAWLPTGIAGYLSGLYQKRVFGNNEYRRIISNEMRQVTTYEHTKYGILLNPSRCVTKSTHFGLTSPQTISPNYVVAFGKKAHLVVRMLELRFGQPVLLQVLNKLLVLARLSAQSVLPSGPDTQAEPLDASPDHLGNRLESTNESVEVVPPCLSDDHRSNLVLSTSSFRRIISMVTGQDIQNFLEQWVFHSGHVRLFAKFHFNRKRNVVELDLKQDLQSRGTLNYTGPITAMLQELDGAFMHTFKLDEGRTSRDLPCHSKSRKHRKKRIPLANGEEVDMDLGRIDSESPLLWLRLDPELAVIHVMQIDQPDYLWHLMLLHDRDCLGQLEAIRALRDFPSAETRHALISVIANERVFYRARMEACFTLCHIANELSTMSSAQSATTNAATSCLLPIFWQLFSSPAAWGLVRQNNFKHLQHYFLMRAICRSLATLRVQQVCPREVLNFLCELSHHNDNSRNIYSDCYYRADLIRAMKDTLTPAIVVRGVMSASSLPSEARAVVEEVTRHLNLDTQIPSYKGVVTVACLAAIRKLQRLGFVPVDPSLFYSYAATGFYIDVRLAAIECLVDFIRGERDQSTLNWIFDQIIERDDGTEASSFARLRFEAVQLMICIPPFQRGEAGSRLDIPELVERLWNLMNYGCGGDSRFRCAVADLYNILYGNRRPTCLPIPEGVLLVRVNEGRSVLNIAGGDAKCNDTHVDDENRLDLKEEEYAVGKNDAHIDGPEEMFDQINSDCLPRSSKKPPVSCPFERTTSHSSLSSHISSRKTVADDVFETESGLDDDYSSVFPVKRTFPFHGLTDSNATEPSAKRRAQRLSDDEDD